jgi:arylsulfatase A
MDCPDRKDETMDRIIAVLAGSVVALSGCAGPGPDDSPETQGAAAEGRDRPNVVLILVDDLGWADTGCYGSTYYETPNIDRLAAEGVRFTDGYAACAVCSPTRAAVMTGRYPARVGVTDWIRARFQGGAIPESGRNPSGYVGGADRKLLCPANALWMEHDEITIAEVLQQAGYTTCHIGKWHLGPDDWYPDRQGFDFNFGGCDYGQPPSYFDPYTNKRLIQGIPTLEPRREGEYLTDREADEAASFIAEYRNEPFFLYYAPYAVHTPIQAKADVRAKYAAKEPTHQTNPTYAAMVESVDDAVGQIMATLDEYELADDTLVIFTSDNGGLLHPVATSNKPLRSGKGYPYEGGIREPVIVRWTSRIEGGRIADAPVTSVDYFPTICAATGTSMPENRVIDGVNLLPYLTGSGDVTRDAIYWHFPHYRQGHRVTPYGIVRSGNYKLIKHYEDDRFELYNLRDDIGEAYNLASSMPSKVRELDAMLRAWLKHTNARMPKRNPDYGSGG